MVSVFEKTLNDTREFVFETISTIDFVTSVFYSVTHIRVNNRQKSLTFTPRGCRETDFAFLREFK